MTPDSTPPTSAASGQLTWIKTQPRCARVDGAGQRCLRDPDHEGPCWFTSEDVDRDD